jgi:hypothetical protein
MLKRIFGTKGKEVTCFINVYASLNIFIVIKTRTMGWVRDITHVAEMRYG